MAAGSAAQPAGLSGAAQGRLGVLTHTFARRLRALLMSCQAAIALMHIVRCVCISKQASEQSSAGVWVLARHPADESKAESSPLELNLARQAAFKFEMHARFGWSGRVRPPTISSGDHLAALRTGTLGRSYLGCTAWREMRTCAPFIALWRCWRARACSDPKCA